MSENLPAKTAFDTLLERMRKDVTELEERHAAAPDEARAPRLQGILDAAIKEARNRSDAIRSTVADGAEALREEMRAHPGASISAAFAAGYMVGKSIAGRSRR